MSGEIGFVPGSQTVTIDEDGSRTGKHGPSCSKLGEGKPGLVLQVDD